MKNHFHHAMTVILVLVAIFLSLEGMVHAKPSSQVARGTILFGKPEGAGNCSDWDQACDLYDAMGSVADIPLAYSLAILVRHA